MRSIEHWTEDVNALLLRLAQMDFGYPIGPNNLLPPDRDASDVPSSLKPFYRVCGGLSWPDVHNGYFIHPPSTFLSSRGSQPTHVVGTETFEVCVFGSDGGGNLFALRVEDGGIYVLPPAAVEGRDYQENGHRPVARVSSDFSEFLERLLNDLEAFTTSRAGYAFLT